VSETTHLFDRDGRIWIPTSATVGPWSDEALHGGPVAALCVGAAEELVPSTEETPLVTTRLTLDLLRPVPTAPLEVVAQVTKRGRRVQLVRVEILVQGKQTAVATVQRTVPKDVELPDLEGTGASLTPPPDLPELFDEPDMGAFGPRLVPFYRETTRMRTPHPQGIYARQPIVAWLKIDAQLTPEIPLSNAAAVSAAADYGNALGAPISPGTPMLFPNADLTVHLTRDPFDGWVRMEPTTCWLEHGIGHTSCQLHDRQGLLGTSTVTLALDNLG
jgi:acyl-CoA thioesterase